MVLKQNEYDTVIFTNRIQEKEVSHISLNGLTSFAIMSSITSKRVFRNKVKRAYTLLNGQTRIAENRKGTVKI